MSMTKAEFIAEAKRRGLPKDQVRVKFESLNARGRFSDSDHIPAVEAVTNAVAKPETKQPMLSEMDAMGGRRAPVKVVGDSNVPKFAKQDSLEARPVKDVPSQLASLDKPPSRTEWKKLGLPGKSSEASRREAWEKSRQGKGQALVLNDKMIQAWKNDPVLSKKDELTQDEIKSLMATSGNKSASDVVSEGQDKADAAQEEVELMKQYSGGDPKIMRQLMSGERKLPYALWDVQAKEAAMPKGDSGIVRRVVADPVVKLAQGVVGIPESAVGLIDLYSGLASLGFSDVNAPSVGKALEEKGVDLAAVKEWIGKARSPNLQRAEMAVDDAEGFIGSLSAMAQNPSAVYGMVAEALPAMAASGGVGAAIVKKAPGLSRVVASALGEGLQGAGSSMEGARQGREGGVATSGDALAALGTGVTTTLFTVLGGKVSDRLGIEDVNTLLAGGKSNAKQKVISSAIARSLAEDYPKLNKVLSAGGNAAAAFISEGGLEEYPQSVSESILSNLANGRPWDEGVAEAGAQGLVVGGFMGVGANAFSAVGRQREVSRSVDNDLNLVQAALANVGLVTSNDKTKKFLGTLYRTQGLEAAQNKVKAFIASVGGNVDEDSPEFNLLMNQFAKEDKINNPRQRFLRALQDASNEKADIVLNDQMLEAFGEWNQVAAIVGEWGGDVAAPGTPEEQAAIDTAKETAPDKWNQYLEAANGRERVAIRVLLADQIQDAETNAWEALAKENEEGVPMPEDVQAVADDLTYEILPDEPVVDEPVIGAKQSVKDAAPKAESKKDRKAIERAEKVEKRFAKKVEKERKEKIIKNDATEKRKLAEWESAKSDEVKRIEKKHNIPLLKELTEDFREDIQIAFQKSGDPYKSPIRMTIKNIIDEDTLEVVYRDGKGRLNRDAMPISRMALRKSSQALIDKRAETAEMDPVAKADMKKNLKELSTILQDDPYFFDPDEVNRIEAEVSGIGASVAKSNIMKGRLERALKLIGRDDVEIDEDAKLSMLLPEIKAALAAEAEVGESLPVEARQEADETLSELIAPSDEGDYAVSPSDVREGALIRSNERWYLAEKDGVVPEGVGKVRAMLMKDGEGLEDVYMRALKQYREQGEESTVEKRVNAEVGRITSELDGIESVKQAIKARSMRYQADAKDEVAAAIGLKGTDLDIEFDKWSAIKKEYDAGNMKDVIDLAKEYGLSPKEAAAPAAAPVKPSVKSPVANLSESDRAAYEKIRDELSSNLLGRTGSLQFIDPENVKLASQLAGYLIKGGAKTFGQFAESVYTDMNEAWGKVKPYLRGAWITAGMEVSVEDAKDAFESIEAEEQPVITDLDIPSSELPYEMSLAESTQIGLRNKEYVRGGQPQWDALAEQAKKTATEVNDEGNLKNPGAGANMLAKVRDGHLPDDKEIALILYEVNQRKLATDKAVKELQGLIDGNASADVVMSQEDRIDELQKQLDEAYDVVAVGVGKFKSRLGAALNALKMTVDERFELVNLQIDYRGRKGASPMSDDENAALETIAKRYKEASEELQKQIDVQAQEIDSLTKIRDELQEQVAANAKMKVWLDTIDEYRPDAGFLSKNKKKFRIMKEEGLSELNDIFGLGKTNMVFVPDPKALKALIKYVSGAIGENVINWSEPLINKFGESVKPYLSDAEKKAKLILMQAEREPDGLVTDDEVDASDLSTKEKKERKSRNLIKRLYDEVMIDMADEIKSGEATMEDVTPVVMKLLEKYPEHASKTEAEVQREFSDYGREVKRDDSELAAARAEIRRQIQVFESYRDALASTPENDIRPKKTGKKRLPDSDKVRELKRMLEAELAAKGISAKSSKDKRTRIDAIKKRLKNRIADLNKALAPGGERIKGEVRDAVVYDDDIKDLIKERDRKQKEYNKMFPKEPISEEQQLVIAIKQRNKRLEEVKKERDDALKGQFKIGRKKKEVTDTVLKSINLEIATIQKEIAGLKEVSVDYQIAKRIEILKRTDRTLKKRIKNKQFFMPERPIPPSLADSPEGMRALKDLAETKLAYARMKESARLADLGPFGWALEGVDRLFEGIKNITGSLDLGALGRQGGKVLFSDPTVWAKAVGPAFRAFSEKQSAKLWQNIAEKENYVNGVYERAKLNIAVGDGTGNFNRTDDLVKPEYINKLPGANFLLGGSQRSFATTLNYMRVGLFERLLANSEDPTDVSTEKIKGIARFVNSWTGSGDLGRLDNRTISALFWAPKFYMSKLDFLTGRYMIVPGVEYLANRGKGKVYGKDLAKLAAMRYVKLAGSLSLIYGTAFAMSKLFGDPEDEEEQFSMWIHPKYITSGLWGGVRVGNSIHNPLGEFISELTFLARVISGEGRTRAGERYVNRRGGAFRTPFATDEMIEAGPPMWNSYVMDFVKSKRTPAITAVWSIISGEDFLGRDASTFDTVTDIAPVSPMNIYEQTKYEKNIAAFIWNSASEIAGFKVNPDYSDPKIIMDISPEEIWKKQFAKKLWKGSTGFSDSMTDKQYDRKKKQVEAAIKHYKALRDSGMSAKEIKLMVKEHNDDVQDKTIVAHFDWIDRNIAPKAKKKRK